MDELIEVVGLTETANAKIVTLSGGQRRRLDVAIGIVGRPELVFFDEPTAGFDPHARRDFHDLVHRLAHRVRRWPQFGHSSPDEPTRYVEVRRQFLREHPGHVMDGWPLPAD